MLAGAAPSVAKAAQPVLLEKPEGEQEPDRRLQDVHHQVEEAKREPGFIG